MQVHKIFHIILVLALPEVSKSNTGPRLGMNPAIVLRVNTGLSRFSLKPSQYLINLPVKYLGKLDRAVHIPLVVLPPILGIPLNTNSIGVMERKVSGAVTVKAIHGRMKTRIQ